MLVLFSIWGYYTWEINAMYPNPENIPVQQGETFTYKGASITATDMQVYQFDELMTAYPDLSNAYDIMGEEGYTQKESAKENNYFTATLNVENNSNEVVTFSKESILYWVIEIGVERNSADFFYFQTLNPSYTSKLQPGEHEEVILCYGILKDYLSFTDIKNSDIKLVYSYYPTKNYVLRKANDKHEN